MATQEHLLSGSVHTLPRVRSGGPRPTRFERQENIRTSVLFSAAMPLDVEAHWTWRNPLNIIPASLLLVLAIGVVGTVLNLM